MSVMYVIPMANQPIRLIMGGACLVFVLAIFGSWLPRVIRWGLSVTHTGNARIAQVAVLALLPIAVGLAPLLILIALIRNPTAYVSDAGVMKEGILSPAPVRFTWAEIAHVSCGTGRGAGPRWFTLVSSDGRKIGLGNPGGVDFRALHLFLEDRLGLAVMDGCTKAVRKVTRERSNAIEQPGDGAVTSSRSPHDGI